MVSRTVDFQRSIRLGTRDSMRNSEIGPSQSFASEAGSARRATRSQRGSKNRWEESPNLLWQKAFTYANEYWD
jgi:hypothetical protein